MNEDLEILIEAYEELDDEDQLNFYNHFKEIFKEIESIESEPEAESESDLIKKKNIRRINDKTRYNTNQECRAKTLARMKKYNKDRRKKITVNKDGETEIVQTL